MIDNYDSFVYNLVRYFEELNQKVKVYRNGKISLDEIKILNPEGIILSPGPKTPKDSGISLQVIKHLKGKIPILGICLGHQSIAYSFGAKIVKGDKPMHGKISSIHHNNKGAFKGLKNPIMVTRYHSLEVSKETLPDCLEITAYSEDGAIMGIKHKEFIIEGLQFHPEALLTECGHDMLENFIIESKKNNRNQRDFAKFRCKSEE